ncbi:MAG: PHP domain-containing protein, partial [Planctomycetota bacterium]
MISGLKSAAQPVCEIEVTSNFSFLAGASLPEELVREAARLGHAGIAMTDAETLGGAVRAHVAAKEASLPLAHGARVWLELGPHAGPHPGEGRALEVLLYATDRASWGALSTLLTRGKRGYAAPAGDESPGGTPDAAAARRWSKSVCVLRFHDLVETLVAARGGATLLAVVVPPWLPDQAFLEAVEGLARLMPDRIAVAVRRIDDPGSAAESGRALVLARHPGVPPVAAGDVRMHDADRHPLLDVLACIGARTTLARAGALVAANAERRLRDPAVLRRRYLDLPEALETAWRFTERASAFSLDALRYEYPSEVVPAGTTAMEHLRALALRGAAERYPRGVPEKVRRQLEHEFAIIGDLRYEHYFLTVHEIVAFARGRGILCQGRGAAANSAVCFALGVTAVDPDRIDVLFERFVSRERNEPPDIDIDFEHERREEVIQHIYAKYGRDRAALVAEIVSYRGRSAVRDVAKVLGFSKDTIDRLASEVDRWSGGGLGSRDDAADLVVDAAGGEPGGSRGSDAPSWPPPVSAAAGERLRAAGLDPGAPMVRHLAHLVGQVLGFPRHRSQHVGGFVITNGPLAECVPIENAAMPDRTVIEWDKDDIDALGMLKIDILSLGMLTAVRKAIDLVNGDRTALALGAAAALAPDAPPARADRAAASASALAGGPGPPDPSLPLEPPELLEFHAIPAEDPSTYDMISRADTVGVFQIESRAQMSMLPRLKPRCFYDLVVEVAIVRPGPIQGDMVHPYLRRRSGEEPVEYPDEAIRRVLGKTLGVPLFQEQAMALAVVAAGFTPGEADELRRAIAAW